MILAPQRGVKMKVAQYNSESMTHTMNSREPERIYQEHDSR